MLLLFWCREFRATTLAVLSRKLASSMIFEGWKPPFTKNDCHPYSALRATSTPTTSNITTVATTTTTTHKSLLLAASQFYWQQLFTADYCLPLPTTHSCMLHVYYYALLLRLPRIPLNYSCCYCCNCTCCDTSHERHHHLCYAYDCFALLLPECKIHAWTFRRGGNPDRRSNICVYLP